jgi:hypothetical protein
MSGNGSLDITDYFSGDQQVFSLSPINKMYLKLTGIQADRSFIEHIHTYPINTEIRTIKTFAVTPPSPPSPVPQPQVGKYFPAGQETGFVTMEFNTSIQSFFCQKNRCENGFLIPVSVIFPYPGVYLRRNPRNQKMS